jgi:hypothetical protein
MRVPDSSVQVYIYKCLGNIFLSIFPMLLLSTYSLSGPLQVVIPSQLHSNLRASNIYCCTKWVWMPKALCQHYSGEKCVTKPIALGPSEPLPKHRIVVSMQHLMTWRHIDYSDSEYAVNCCTLSIFNFVGFFNCCPPQTDIYPEVW